MNSLLLFEQRMVVTMMRIVDILEEMREQMEKAHLS